MIHQINLENIKSVTYAIKKSSTNIKPLLVQEEDTRKGLLKTLKADMGIENELVHLLNVLDNNMETLDQELEDFKSEICMIGLKNKNSQIECLLDK
ncbi:uncharacterized protein VNE69_08075 [Vairimorpha necatrix]|uniref:Uncharacterized protein n=1 Tax=Vairimorpha necatrix TaxID=6039 RepID=A0AAX4JEN9_9MICR